MCLSICFGPLFWNWFHYQRIYFSPLQAWKFTFQNCWLRLIFSSKGHWVDLILTCWWHDISWNADITLMMHAISFSLYGLQDNFLTLSQTTNFRLFQTERVCRRQFQIWRKWQKAIPMGRKHCGKRRNCSLRAISPFPTVFSKDLYCRHVKTRACLGKG